MIRVKRMAALLAVLALALVLTACGGQPAPQSYELSTAGITLDSFTKVVGDRGFKGVTETRDGDKVDSIVANYSEVTDAMGDLGKYGDYLEGLGFIDYLGLEDRQLSMALRSGDGAVLVSGKTSFEDLELRISHQDVLEMCLGETQYVSGSSMAFMPSPEMIVFKYPTLMDEIPAQETVDQQILDGVNAMIQFAKETAAHQGFKLMGSYGVSSALPSELRIDLTGEFEMGENVTTLTSTITIRDLLGTPQAEYSPITAG